MTEQKLDGDALVADLMEAIREAELVHGFKPPRVPLPPDHFEAIRESLRQKGAEVDGKRLAINGVLIVPETPAGLVLPTGMQ